MVILFWDDLLFSYQHLEHHSLEHLQRQDLNLHLLRHRYLKLRLEQCHFSFGHQFFLLLFHLPQHQRNQGHRSLRCCFEEFFHLNFCLVLFVEVVF